MDSLFKCLFPVFSTITHRAEVGVLRDVTRHSLVAGRGRHDQQQCISGLLSDGAVPMDERYEQREDQQVGGALLGRRRSEQHLEDHGLPRHGHADLVENGRVFKGRNTLQNNSYASCPVVK